MPTDRIESKCTLVPSPCECAQCGDSFTPRSRGRTRPPQRYCSKTCRDLAHRKLATKTCPNCAKDYRPRRAEQVYCSKACVPGAPTGTTVQVVCPQCSTAFSVKPHEVAVRTYCSVACKGAAARVERPEATCPECGALFERRRGSVVCSRACAAKIARRNLVHPSQVGSRTLLAQSCATCGLLLGPREFDTSGDGYHRKTCRTCVRSALTPERAERLARTSAIADARAQRRTHPAPHWGDQWTGAELEIALRDDLTSSEAAVMLGRTYYAVQAARHKARTDPKWIQVVGA